MLHFYCFRIDVWIFGLYSILSISNLLSLKLQSHQNFESNLNLLQALKSQYFHPPPNTIKLLLSFPEKNPLKRFFYDVRKRTMEKIFSFQKSPGIKHEKIICDRREGKKGEKANKLEGERAHYTRKKKKNGQNDIMTEGRTRYMIVGVERTAKLYVFCLGSFPLCVRHDDIVREKPLLCWRPLLSQVEIHWRGCRI
jgi:hypothetical protein